MSVRWHRFLLIAALALGGSAGSANASELIARDATAVRLSVSRSGVALLTYRAGGQAQAVSDSGAVNARNPSQGQAQVAFDLSRSTGSASHAQNVCRPYDGPALHWLVTACKAPDGSYWAVQSWQRMLPNYGLHATADRAARELRLSHWTGPTAELMIKVDWSYGGRFDHLYGAFTYRDKPVYGFRSTRFGVPLDTYGRNIYVDTFNSSYGTGWHRENSFLAHRPRGNFCYGFYPHAGRPVGKGRAYRATAIGPGVTPDVFWEGKAPGPYDRVVDLRANAEQRLLGPGDSRCHPN
jgi:hypothetical protein